MSRSGRQRWNPFSQAAFIKACACTALAVLVTDGPLAGASSVPAPAVERALALKKELESKHPAINPDSLLQIMETNDQDLCAYLKSNPGDSEAAVLLMQIHEGRATFNEYAKIFSGDLEEPRPSEPYLEIVEGALRTDSLNAELHYWKSRLCSLPQLTPDGQPAGIPRLSEAVQEARRSVAIDAKEPGYRNNLAYLLLLAGDEPGAREMFRRLDKNHPLYLLLHDWERMPVIEGTIAQKNYGAFMLPISSPLAYEFAGMIRSYVFCGPATALEKSCRAHWPSFRLLLDPDTTRHRPGTRRYAQHLRWRGDNLEPDAVLSDVTGGQQPGAGGGGIWVEVLEIPALATDPPDLHPGVSPGQPYCRLEFYNKRGPD